MKKVLIVDDEFLIRFTLEEGLKDLRGMIIIS